jgi:hypothetical protein
MFGDLVGNGGCAVFQKHAQKLKKEYKADGIIVNGENSASNGRGITPKIVASLKHNGADVITTGNHAFQKKESYSYYSEHKDLLRPLNFPASCPGTGVTTFRINDITVGVINVQGQGFMNDNLSCPFRATESALAFLRDKTNIVVVDMHAETTSEKIGMAWYLDGKVSAVVGTHTHVQTADERILPGGTAFITDLGMAGAYNSMIGMKKEPVLFRMINQMPAKFEVETGPPYVISGVCIEIDTKTGHAIEIERFRVIDEELTVE